MNDSVSVVIPCYNEERFIQKALENLKGQYEPGRYEILVVDGRSTDRTRSIIAAFQRDHPDCAIRILDNPARNIPTALNLAVDAAHGNIIARMDAHAVPSKHYIRDCVRVLRETRAGVVGFPCRVQPGADSLVARAIAYAVSHPFGIGDATYRLGGNGSLRESVDTVAFGCFDKTTWAELHGFNEALLTNEDYDFNYRVRQTGRLVILDRSAHCDYFARSTLAALMKQYFRYGAWKAQMIRLNPGSIRARHLAAPLLVLSLGALIIGSFISNIVLWILLAEVVIYLLSSLLAALHIVLKAKANPLMLVLLPTTFAAIHLSWGSSFLLRLLMPPARVKRA
jgi:glycosyltransferase involved in cell wall biosynthesis